VYNVILIVNNFISVFFFIVLYFHHIMMIIDIILKVMMCMFEFHDTEITDLILLESVIGKVIVNFLYTLKTIIILITIALLQFPLYN
jgi:hypothetical protein